MGISTLGNKYLHDQEPWEVIKENTQRANDIFYNGAILLKTLAVVSAPFMPSTVEKIWKQLNLSGSPSEPGIWDKACEPFEKEVHQVGTPQILFEKIKDSDIERYKEKVSNPIALKDFFE